MKDKTMDLIHIKIHALRMIPNYKASRFEQELSKLISEEYENVCDECKEKVQYYKYNPIKDKPSFFGSLIGGK